MENLTLRDYIGNTLYVTLKDGRILNGEFMAIDAQCNLLLDRVREQSKSATAEVSSRLLGLVSVPSDTVEKVEVPQYKMQEMIRSRAAFMQNIV
ncbi:Mak31p KNAG_0C04780 [Huiozyma naganishii CBS 8797]|uniref:Sm domain-containing protein n=1 Tax=Huiozyma naganishii (strain ATCC MYA-139 / BCRC 22969 / CBS 8797 / KCTC 17520 / NBRC 10181 / NCYC 3082 / Yp74L-3) TaxID=1071383 RepID=J7S4Z9_HUIN7|nr:hypothetical protein KNAG_0C04780 [Kazachstania naganishii CBS 8797]CCK69579.1 hypothetical protein KNAG_0C04780 [Kazachstania naganishii CBS 8797]